MIKFFKQTNSGFTLVETLIAVSIFSMTVVVMMTVLSSGISDINNAKKKMVATYLAQEGIECMRNMRDNAALSQSGWNSFVPNISACEYNGSGFLRTVHTISGTNTVKITSTVSYGNKEIRFSENLYNWIIE